MTYLKTIIVVLGLVLVLGYLFYDSDEQSVVTESNGDTTSASQVQNIVTSSNDIEIYSGIKYPENIQTVDLSDRGLAGSLKAEVRLLAELEVLNISDNKFTGLPAEVGQLSQLRVLNLSNNPLTGLPYELGNLKNLTVLDLRGTNYAAADLEVIKQSLPATTEILTD